MNKLRLSTKQRISETLDETYFTQYGFEVYFPEEKSILANIIFLSEPRFSYKIEYQENGYGFRDENPWKTIETPGNNFIVSETFKRKKF